MPVRLPWDLVCRTTIVASLLSVSACDYERTNSARNEGPLYPDTVVPELVASWGQIAGDEEYVFTEITSFAVDKNGGLIVHDLGRGVRRFWADGSFRDYLARVGEGPTEVKFAAGIAVASDGRVALWDMGNRRLVVFADDGGLLESFPVPNRHVSYDENSLFFDDEGDLWFKIALDPLHDGVGYPRPAFARASSGGGGDTLFVDSPPAPECSERYDATYRRGFWEDKRAPWFPVLITSMGPDGSFAWACSSEMNVSMATADGPREVVLPRRGLAIESEERDFFAAWQPLPPRPSNRAELARVILPGNGWVWLWPTQPPRRFQPTADAQRRGAPSDALGISEDGAFEVVDPDGKWVGTVALPEGVRFSGFPTTPPVWIRGDTLWAVRLGEFEEQYVSKFVVRWPNGELGGR